MLLAGWATAVTWARRRLLETRSIVLACATLLAAPYLFDYDLVLIAVPLALLIRDGLANGFPPWQKSLLCALWVVPVIARPSTYWADLPVTPILLALCVGLFTLSSWQYKSAAHAVAVA